jgi:FixJ family two-component response regulator
VTPAASIYVVDDDEDVLFSLRRVLQRAGYTVHAFGSAIDFLRDARPEPPCCVLLDVHMPEMSGLDVQQRLLRSSQTAPIVFITGFQEVPVSVQALKSGAVDFLLKPFGDEALLEAVDRAVRQSVVAARKHQEMEAARQRLSALTPREREVCSLVAEGLTSREIGERLGTAESTVALHRAHMMAKLQAGSVADVVRLVDLAGSQRPD